MSTPLLPIRFVLVEPSHPGNIGAVARAMKNMALSELVLVAPKEFPHPDATVRAAGADDLLASARIAASLPEAIADCGFVLATTARSREHHFNALEPRAAAHRVVAEARTGSPVAVVFGTERFGLSNDHLLLAHAVLRIPANPAYESLNVAMAAQLIAWEILMVQREPHAHLPLPDREVPLATPSQMQQFFEHLQGVMDEVDFRDRTQKGASLMARIKRMFNRAELDANEVNILRGFLTSVQSRRRRAGEPQ